MTVASLPAHSRSLADRLDALLPQTQCTRCGYPDCRAYAEALAGGDAEADRCPPGGAEGARRLAHALGRAPRELAAENGIEGPRHVVYVDESRCIGCTLCIQACPVDAILGGAKRMHVVVEPECTGCDLCLPACPVDCLLPENVTGTASGWQAWSPERAERARARYLARRERLARDDDERLARLAALARTDVDDEPPAAPTEAATPSTVRPPAP